jgi:CBS domain-containing protein
MTNRQLVYIVKDQKPLVLAREDTVRQACRCMWERRCGSVLVVDRQQRLSGIFTGRDAVRLLAKGSPCGSLPDLKEAIIEGYFVQEGLLSRIPDGDHAVCPSRRVRTAAL